jgi:uncharacterized membrane protein
MQADNTKIWQAELSPHRSLTRQGYLLLLGLVVVVNLVIAGMFIALGAWPIAGFAGLDVLIVWWAFRANYASARRMERIRISEHELIFQDIRDGTARVERKLVRRWVRVELEEDRERELVGRLMLVSGPSRISVGEFLSAEERKTLAQALRAALAIPRI